MPERYISKLTGAVKLSVCDNAIIALMGDGTLTLCGERPPFFNALSELRCVSDFAVSAERIITVDDIGRAYTVADGSAVLLWQGVADVAAIEGSVFALRQDGSVVTDDTSEEFAEVSRWSDITQLAGDYGCLIGLRSDGTVLLAGKCAAAHDVLTHLTGVSAVRAGGGMAAALMISGRVVLSGAEQELPANSSAIVDVALGDELVLALLENGETIAVGTDFMGSLECGGWINISAIAAGGSTTAAVRLDGRVVGAGMPIWDSVPDDWRGITAVDTAGCYFVGLHSSGRLCVASKGGQTITVAAAELSNVKDFSVAPEHLTVVLNDGRAVSTEWELGSYQNIIASSSGESRTILLSANGTAETENNSNRYGECEVISWSGIKQVACGADHTVGLRADGTVIAVGYNRCGQCDVDKWHNIISVAAGMNASYGVRADGTVAVAGDGAECAVTGWHNIKKIAAGRYFALGIRYDGSVLYAGPEDALPGIECWSDIIDAAADIDAIGLRRDGTVITTEYIIKPD